MNYFKLLSLSTLGILLSTQIVWEASAQPDVIQLAAGGAGLRPAAPSSETKPLPDNSQRLMMIPFENHLKNQDPSISEMALDTLQMQLIKPQNRVFKLIDRRQVKAMLAELAFSESELSDPQNALKLGKLLSANLMLSGSVTAGKIHTSEVTNLQPTEYTWATIQVTTTLTNIETGEILFSSKASGISDRYPNWQGGTFTSIIVEAVERASSTLAQELVEAQPRLQPAELQPPTEVPTPYEPVYLRDEEV